MKKLIYAIIVMISLSMVACQPDDVATKYDNPNWTYSASTDFNVNMTATIQLPSNILPYLMEDDQMVALVGEEIRGVSQPYENGLFFITIRGLENEISNITFRYWSAKTSYMYETTDVIPFEENAILGTPDEPFIPTFQIK